MCGRYHVTKLKEEIEKMFGAEVEDDEELQTYNAAPSQNLPLVASNKPAKIQRFKWGLIPSWSKEEAIGFKMINARIETLKEKPSFKSLVDEKRCAVITDGYYEWQKLDNTNKQPWRICKKDKSLFAYAGLWTSWKNPENKIINSFTIITTEPHQTLAQIHNRMPVMINPDAVNAWLMNEIQLEQLQREMISSKDLIHYPVSKAVGNTRNNSPELLKEEEPTTLF